MSLDQMLKHLHCQVDSSFHLIADFLEAQTKELSELRKIKPREPSPLTAEELLPYETNS